MQWRQTSGLVLMVRSPPVIVHLPAFVAIAPLPPNIFPNKLASNVPTNIQKNPLLFFCFIFNTRQLFS